MELGTASLVVCDGALPVAIEPFKNIGTHVAPIFEAYFCVDMERNG